jgi:hypothetical protein
MIELVAPTFLNSGISLVKELISRKIEYTKLKAEQEERLKVVLFWMKQEISYNLDILSVWDGPDHTFDLDPPQVRRLCGHLRTEICSLIAADLQISAGLKSVLDKVNFATENLGFNGESDPKKLTGLAAFCCSFLEKSRCSSVWLRRAIPLTQPSLRD